METTISSDQKVSDALARVQQAIEAENRLPAPNPFVYALLRSLLTILPISMFCLGVQLFFVAVTMLPLTSDAHDRAHVLDLTRDSLSGFIAGLLIIGLVSFWWMVPGMDLLLEKLCRRPDRQQLYHFNDDRPKAPPALRDAVHELRNCWPTGEPEPRLTLQFPFDDGWIRVPTKAHWTLEFPKPVDTQLLPPATRERSYPLTRF